MKYHNTEVKSLKNYIAEHNLEYSGFADKLDIEESTLMCYISGEIFPTKEDLEKIFIMTKGAVQPIDFLFKYREKFDFIKHIDKYISEKVITRKDIVYELNLSLSSVTRKLNGERDFTQEEINIIMKLIEKRKKKRKKKLEYAYLNWGEKILS